MEETSRYLARVKNAPGFGVKRKWKYIPFSPTSVTSAHMDYSSRKRTSIHLTNDKDVQVFGLVQLRSDAGDSISFLPPCWYGKDFASEDICPPRYEARPCVRTAPAVACYDRQGILAKGDESWHFISFYVFI